MPVLTFSIYASATAVAPVFWPRAIPVGFIVDQPLKPDFNTSQPGSVIGNITIPAFGVAGELSTSIAVNAAVGDHYVILGVKVPSYIEGPISQYTLELRGAGQQIRQTFSADAGMNIYVAFRINRDLSITPLGTGQIAFNGAPIQSPGAGGIFGSGGDPAEMMMNAIAPMLEMMLPIIMVSMLIQMMVGMMQGLVAI